MSTAVVPTVILCGGRGTRMREVSTALPKPMVPIGNRPILWHIMKIYAAAGCFDFHLALGYLGETIKEFFLHYEAMTCDFTIELGEAHAISYLGSHPERGWRVSCVDTGLDALTGTRLRRIARHLPDGPMMVTYGDCVGDVDVVALLEHHRSSGRLATMTAVHPPGRFGELSIDDDNTVLAFEEKPQTSSGAINGGFMVFEREAIERFVPEDEDVMLEREPLSALAAAGQLGAYRHDGFWQPMDTPREQQLLAELWASGKAPWKTWS
ncbi:MAG: glucose-phosphate cytidylyltransferase [Actinomycetota bacterium]|jgi:glucose-1-phosphate cytidylyltransferase